MRGCLFILGATFCVVEIASSVTLSGSTSLIPAAVPILEWVQFYSEGYSWPVSGIIFDDRHPTCCGLGLGGISTGSLELDVNGTIGFDTLFQGYPKKLQRHSPFLGISINGKTWVLAAPGIIRGDIQTGCHEPGRDPYTGPRKWNVAIPTIAGVSTAEQIRYFAHFPVVSYQYELDAPVGVGLRAWAPFIPGDLSASSIPAIIFEVELQNLTNLEQHGTIAFNYPGIQMPEAKNARWADSGNKGDYILKQGAQPFDGKVLLETQPRFSRPNPGGPPGGKMVIGDPSEDGRPELLVGLRDGKTGRGFLLSFQRTAESYGGAMDGGGKYEWEVIDELSDDGFSAVAVGDVGGDGHKEIMAGTQSGKLFLYRRKRPGFQGGSATPLALYERKRLNPAQADAGHISEIRLGDFYGTRKTQIVYTIGYHSAHSLTKPGAYIVDNDSVYPISTDTGSEYLGCAAGDFSGNGHRELAVASKSGNPEKNWVQLFRLQPHGRVQAQETALKLGANEGPQWLVAGDFNGDGRDDLLVGTIKRGTLWMQRDGRPLGAEQAWSQPEVTTAQDFAAYSDPVKGYQNDPKTYVAVGGQNTVILGRLNGAEVPPGRGVWGMERYVLGPHQALTDATLPAVALGDLSGDGVLDILTWNNQGELTGVTYEGGKFFDILRPRATKREIKDKPRSTVVSLPFHEQYAVSLLDAQDGRFGGDLTRPLHGWADLDKELPVPDASDTGASVALDFKLAPSQTTTLRLALSWYVPQWRSTYTYTRMNVMRYRDVMDVARYVDETHVQLLERIRRWQGILDREEDYPVWLKDALINSLALIPADSYWAVAQPPLGDWCFPDGLYAMIESPRAAPQTECIPCTWYGNIPLVYFYPELTQTTLRGFKQYQRASDGAMAFNFAPRDELWWTGDHALENQIALNGFCFVDLVNRQWLRTGDDAVIQEFYPAVKDATQFAANARPKQYGLMHMPAFGSATEWWEGWQWEGLTTHAGSLNLTGALIAQRMARKVADEDFARKCQVWIDQGRKLLEKQMWNGQDYLLFKNPTTGRMADEIMANQFDAEWVTSLAGLPHVFDLEHFRTGLDTVRKTCIVDTGIAAFASKTGKPQLKAYGNFIPEAFILAMTFMYAGDNETGLDICKRALDNLYRKQRYAFDWPNQIDCETGARTYGTDYYQNMIVWAITAALHGQNLAQATARGSLVDRIIKAGRASARVQLSSQTEKPAGTHDNLVPAYVPAPDGGDIGRPK